MYVISATQDEQHTALEESVGTAIADASQYLPIQDKLAMLSDIIISSAITCR